MWSVCATSALPISYKWDCNFKDGMSDRMKLRAYGFFGSTIFLYLVELKNLTAIVFNKTTTPHHFKFGIFKLQRRAARQLATTNNLHFEMKKKWCFKLRALSAPEGKMRRNSSDSFFSVKEITWCYIYFFFNLVLLLVTDFSVLLAQLEDNKVPERLVILLTCQKKKKLTYTQQLLNELRESR